MHKFVLPLPPPINQTYGGNNEGGLYKKKLATDWEEEAGWIAKMQWKSPKIPFVHCQIGIHFFYRNDRDIDAGIKILLDLFQSIGLYLNDKAVRRFTHVDISEDKIDPRVEVEISEFVKGGE